MCGGTCWKKTRRFFSSISVEPVYFLFCLSHGLYSIVAQSLYIDKETYSQFCLIRPNVNLIEVGKLYSTSA
jgi:hypothetical protein